MDGFPNLPELQAAQRERKGTLLSLALHMLARSQDLNSLELGKLKDVFCYSLTDEHSERAGFDFFAAKLKENEIEGWIPEAVDTPFGVRTTPGVPDEVIFVKVTDADFQLADSLYQFYAADIRVRRHIARCLDEQIRYAMSKYELSELTASKKAAFQLAMCYHLGFGITRSEQQTQKYLQLSGKSLNDMVERLSVVSSVGSPGYRNRTFSDLWDNGLVRHPDLAQVHRDYPSILNFQLLYEQEVSDIQNLLMESHPLVLYVKHNFGIYLYHTGLYRRAAETLESVLKYRSKDPQDLGTDSFALVGALATVYENLGRLKEAESLKKDAFESSTKIHGPRHLITAVCISHLAEIQQEQGKWKEAAELLYQCIDIQSEVLGDEHPDVCNSMITLSQVLSRMDEWDCASDLAQRAEAAQRKMLGRRHPDFFRCKLQLASILYDQGKLDEAADIEREVVNMLNEALGEEHPDAIECVSNLAVTLAYQSKWDEAECLLEKAVPAMVACLGRKTPRSMNLMANLSMVYREKGRWSKATAIDRELYNLSLEVYGPQSLHTTTVMHELALDLLQTRSTLGEAESMMAKVVLSRTDLLGPDHSDTIDSKGILADIYSEEEKLDEAVTLAEEVTSKKTALLGSNHPDTLGSLTNLATIYYKADKFEEARDVEKDVLDKCLQLWGPNNSHTIAAMSQLAMTYETLENFGEAENLARQAVILSKEHRGDEHEKTIFTIKNLAEILERNGKLHEARDLYVEACRLGRGNEDFDEAELPEIEGMLENVELRLQEVHDSQSPVLDRPTTPQL